MLTATSKTASFLWDNVLRPPKVGKYFPAAKTKSGIYRGSLPIGISAAAHKGPIPNRKADPLPSEIKLLQQQRQQQ